MPGVPEETPGKPSGETPDGSADRSADRSAGGSPDESADGSSRARLEREVGVLPWSELVRHFARGVVIVVDAEITLVDAALGFTEDDSARVGAWLESGQVARASDDDARGWVEDQPHFRCVVVAPWVLVQVRERG